MDGLTFHKIINIIRKRYVGAGISRISVLKDQLYITLFKNNPHILTFRSSPPPALEISDVAAGDSPGALANLNNAIIVSVGGRAYDRLGWIDLEKRKPSGKLISYRLVFEPMGNYGNAFLLNADGVILYRLSSRTIDADRDIGVGKSYMQPKANKRYSLDNYNGAENFIELTGFYPVTAVCAAKYASHMGFDAAADFIKNELCNEYFYRTNGKILPFPPDNEAQAISFDELKAMNGAATGTSQLFDRIIKLYTKQFKHYQKLYEKISNELLNAGKYEALLAEAELIKSNLHIIKGIGKYSVIKYTDVGQQTVDYEYRSDESPSVYADKLYKKGARMKRSVPLLQTRLEEVIQLMESAEEQLYFADNAAERDLKELSELLKKTPTGKQQEKKRELQVFREFHRGNAVIYIGRSSAGNHKLVFQFAISTDIWMHARNIPSAHCIVRSDGMPPAEVLEFAAKLTAAFSKNRNELRVPIDYTYRKYVKKPKNTPIGFVTYERFKTITVTPFTEKELAEIE